MTSPYKTRGSVRNSNDTALSFPNPVDLADRPVTAGGAGSAISSLKEEDGDGIMDGAGGSGSSAKHPPQGFMGRVQGLTGPAGETGLPPSRPSSAATGKSGAGSNMAHGQKLRGSATGSVGGANSRPPTSHSRTHVPSIAASAFFRPMSSQRLQAQRGQRPMSFLGSAPIGGLDGHKEYSHGGVRNIQVANGQNTRGGPGVIGLRREERPMSRDTDIAEFRMPERATANTSPNGAETVRSMGESEAPLSGGDPDTERYPTRLDLAKPFKNSAPHLPAQKSPRSFRSSFMSPNRQSRSSTAMRPQGHEKLMSTPSTPQISRRTSKRMAQQETVNTDLGKNHEYFSGNTVFCCGGRLQNTRERPISVGTCFVMVLPASLFLTFSAPWLWHHVSPAIPITFAYLFLICLSSFLHASLTNPGILPRNLHPFPPSMTNEDPLALGPNLTEWTLVVSATSATAAMEVPTKFCKTCNIWRPPRAHHCRNCDNCVESQDHHCVWLNNCVGRRNYRYFFTFVFSGSLLSLYLLGGSLAHILLFMKEENITFAAAVNRWRVPFAMVIYAALIFCYPASLTGYHLFLMSRGETTREYLQSHKFLKKDRHRPFTQGGFLKNWIAVLGRPRPPTYLQFKKEFEEGDQRLGEKKRKRASAQRQQSAGVVGSGVEMQNIGGFERSLGRAEARTAGRT